MSKKHGPGKRVAPERAASFQLAELSAANGATFSEAVKPFEILPVANRQHVGFKAKPVLPRPVFDPQSRSH
jgi:hypothetical protein